MLGGSNIVTGRIHSTESFGTVDGPGIRFVVFMQGCPMRCAYCHNPDSWATDGGQEMTVGELLDLYNKYKNFYSKGGLTVSGGEPLLQIEFVTELFMQAKKQGIHTCLDTSGVTFRADNTENFDRLMKYTDLVLLDIKHIDDARHRELTGHGNTDILAFAMYLRDSNIPVWARHVVVPNLTDDEDSLMRLGELISTLSNIKSVDVLSYHDMGKNKYEKLGIEYKLKDTPPLSQNECEKAKKIILNGIDKALRK